MAKLRQATHDAVRDGCIASAHAVLPRVFAALGTPDRLIDVGAGEGHWMTTAAELGVAWVWGVDLDAEPELQWDAESGAPLPTVFEATGLDAAEAGARWPLALCLEVAEHVSPAAGDHLVAELCRVSAAVLWSAAIPGQGGDGHVNEQWPSYWQDRFWQHGWTLSDPFREALWSDRHVEPWYAQNTLLAQPVSDAPSGVWTVRHLVHPTTWLHHRGLA